VLLLLCAQVGETPFLAALFGRASVVRTRHHAHTHPALLRMAAHTLHSAQRRRWRRRGGVRACSAGACSVLFARGGAAGVPAHAAPPPPLRATPRRMRMWRGCVSRAAARPRRGGGGSGGGIACLFGRPLPAPPRRRATTPPCAPRAAAPHAVLHCSSGLLSRARGAARARAARVCHGARTHTRSRTAAAAPLPFPHAGRDASAFAPPPCCAVRAALCVVRAEWLDAAALCRI
jgi:hypothetical protein